MKAAVPHDRGARRDFIDDEGGPIGKGRHARAIVRVDRLLDGAARRNAAGT